MRARRCRIRCRRTRRSNQAVRPLIDELARNVTSPFEVMEAMGEIRCGHPAGTALLHGA